MTAFLRALATVFLLAALAFFFTTPTHAAPIDDQFRSWLQTDLWPEAKSKGISKKTFDEAFLGVKPNLSLPDLVMPGETPTTPEKQHQSEFGPPANYFAEKIVRAVTTGGRTRESANSRVLGLIEKRYGVPGEIVLAIWGRETGFGAARMPYDAFEVLGTKAFMSTKKDFFRTEVLAALEIVERGLAPVNAMKSSWAGALGQPQFMPTSFLKHAVDFDGDGRPDIWNSTPDVLASIANYLVHYGWVRGRGWGTEVTVPASISCSLEGPDQGKKISDWVAMGIRRVDNKAFQASEMKAESSLLMPAGRSGPAFLVTPNFYVIKQYNNSDLYGLFIGHAAERIAKGDATFVGNWGPVGDLHRSDIAALQRALEAKGYDVGNADGLPGFKTRRSIGVWQAKNGKPATCFPDSGLVAQLK
ncbi:lytic murein transglycosylase [Mesorhizobium sp. M2D.F.Ca.ET.185.01.1.1]|uniref:lytic murein transglycosylase n=3 Tax=Mesorhizobium TaxID=68287 RepID=UPI000FCA21AF|nr:MULTISPECIES: lytic murein transglycosylase [unclassified Mesorhizobium]TGP78080.1 lytic murein transglycosylase [bacterium M00.F.Ca.ET.227.01.1.1]TGP88202.1 lytic murein transglycosylase [bacterium M00.F.Ca.ET.221.01.1.1]TGP93416.1 lytic murein transglycosylase [bacterium M00.F.Ca.ET.222.01.1.1]TGU13012.1 lytic murein transglycosylase [bacterium M00.F.Ca.ET.163.01.1.1]TGU31496.1 lytic murein transglycosylase [bacterium M00.F.Ca.ET.156.01.1.1]TGU45391.1 lytic murein transglycosylase [bacte